MVLTAVAVVLAGAQPVVAGSPDPRDPAGSSTSTTLADGYGASAAPANDPEPSSDWHLYHHWTDPSWPDPDPDPSSGPATPRPERTRGGGHHSTPPMTLLPSSDWVPPTDSYPSTTEPPLTSDSATTSPAAAPTSAPPPATGTGSDSHPDRVNRDPVAGGPDASAQGGELGLGDQVDEPTPTPRPTVADATGTPDAPLAVRPVRANTEPTSYAPHTLVYSGMLGLALALIGFMMIGRRRRRW